jgi:prepilin-type N-terminal cleavage/methylation domain-containing protein
MQVANCPPQVAQQCGLAVASKLQIGDPGQRKRDCSKPQPPVPQHSRLGFTLVELLVVIAIIGILVALLLPAIQAAREAARRAKCQSNLHNLAIAALNYESAKKRLPQGFISTGPGVIESWGWGVFILPYLEEQAIYDQLRPSETFLEPISGTRTGKRNLADVFIASASNANELVPLQTPLPVYRCPSDSTPNLVPCVFPDGSCNYKDVPKQTSDQDLWTRSFRDGEGWKQGGANAANFLPSASNYVGNKGFIDNNCPGAGPPWVMNDLLCANNGVFYGNSDVTLQKISDGTGKTFLIGERDRFCMAATWIGARNPNVGAEPNSSIWTIAHVAVELNNPFTQAYDFCTEGFSSAHPGGGFFAFCDGSVRFITDDISSDLAGNNIKTCTASKSDSNRCRSSFGTAMIGVYQRLAWRDDGETIPDTSY